MRISSLFRSERALRPHRIFFWTVAIAGGLLETWPHRFSIKPDGLNYLDIASAYLRHDWAAAINSYWSPLYSWLLAAVVRIFHPSAYWESTVLHVLHLFIFLFVFRSGEFFLSELVADQPEDRLPAWSVWWIGYTLLLFVSLFMIHLHQDTPDLLLSGLVYLAAGLLVRIRSGRASQLIFVAFGVVLALAYFSKTIMFLLAFPFLIAAGFRRGTVLAFACFVAVCLPWIAALSHATGHLTYGDAGPTNYVFFVAHSGVPLHPPRLIFSSPPVREFAGPIQATYAPWYNPPYWLAGMRPRFDWRAQLHAIVGTVRDYLHFLYGQKEFVTGFLVLLLARPRTFSPRWWLLLPPLVGLGLYSLIYVEPRYVGAFFFLFWTALFAGLGARSQRLVLCVSLFVVMANLFKVSRDFVQMPKRPEHVLWQMAQTLNHMGIPPGSRIAFFGHGDNTTYYWARLAGFRIVADIQEQDLPQFWSAPPPVRAEILERLAALNVRAVVSSGCPTETWKHVGDTPYCVRLLTEPG